MTSYQLLNAWLQFMLGEAAYRFLFLARVTFLLLLPAIIHSKRKGFVPAVTLREFFFFFLA